MTTLIPSERIEQSILLIRGHKVMLDADLAQLYGVPTKVLNQAVKRNKNRFPPDFMFQLTEAEKDGVVTVCDHLRRLRFSPSLPHAFTEYGAIMLATVLNSQRAIEASIYVVRAFVRLREALATHRAVARKLAELERRIESHDEHIQSPLSVRCYPPAYDAAGTQETKDRLSRQRTGRKIRKARIEPEAVRSSIRFFILSPIPTSPSTIHEHAPRFSPFASLSLPI